MKRRINITFDIPDDGGTLAYRTLRALLKHLLRCWGIRCRAYREEASAIADEVTAEANG